MVQVRENSFHLFSATGRRISFSSLCVWWSLLCDCWRRSPAPCLWAAQRAPGFGVAGVASSLSVETSCEQPVMGMSSVHNSSAHTFLAHHPLYSWSCTWKPSLTWVERDICTAPSILLWGPRRLLNLQADPIVCVLESSNFHMWSWLLFLVLFLE